MGDGTVREEDVMAELEDILGDAFAKMGIEFPARCARFSTGTQWIPRPDKPDTRIGMELQ